MRKKREEGREEQRGDERNKEGTKCGVQLQGSRGRGRGSFSAEVK